MSIVKQEPMSRTSITIVVVVLLCAAGFAYSQGWFNWSSSSNKLENNQVITDQRIDPVKTNENVPHVTQQTNEPAATRTE
jgi:hypothetical protein